MKASQVLLTWLERGEVDRRNINTFYSMIQCTNSHIRRLLMEKQGHEDELLKMKEKFKNIFEGILRQCKYAVFKCSERKPELLEVDKEVLDNL